MPPLTRKRRDLRFDGVLSTKNGKDVILSAPICDREGSEASTLNEKQDEAWKNF